METREGSLREGYGTVRTANTFSREKGLSTREVLDMLLSESEDELDQLESEFESESEYSNCSLDEDYIPR